MTKVRRTTEAERYWDSRARQARLKGDDKEHERLRRKVLLSQAQRWMAAAAAGGVMLGWIVWRALLGLAVSLAWCIVFGVLPLDWLVCAAGIV